MDQLKADMNGFFENRPLRTLVCALALLGAGALAAASQVSGVPGELPQSVPVPPAKPAPERALASVAPAAAQRMPAPGIDAVMPVEERVCRTRLTALGVEFEELPRIDDEGECGIAFPIEVGSLGRDVELTPDGVMNCATALAAAELVRGTAMPAAGRELDAELTGVVHASTYICRHRAGGGKISEHARGNALDISAFVMADGRIVDVTAYGPADMPERRFMRSVRRAACGPFKTVLGPGTDADHAHHFHFDLAERRRGSTYCR